MAGQDLPTQAAEGVSAWGLGCKDFLEGKVLLGWKGPTQRARSPCPAPFLEDDVGANCLLPLGLSLRVGKMRRGNLL